MNALSSSPLVTQLLSSIMRLLWLIPSTLTFVAYIIYTRRMRNGIGLYLLVTWSLSILYSLASTILFWDMASWFRKYGTNTYEIIMIINSLISFGFSLAIAIGFLILITRHLAPPVPKEHNVPPPYAPPPVVVPVDTE